MNVSATYPSFTATKAAGNPLAQTVRVTGNIERWKVTNIFNTSWLRISPNAGYGEGIFTISVNIYDTSVVLGTQTGVLLVDSLDPEITMIVSLTVSAV